MVNKADTDREYLNNILSNDNYTRETYIAELALQYLDRAQKAEQQLSSIRFHQELARPEITTPTK